MFVGCCKRYDLKVLLDGQRWKRGRKRDGDGGTIGTSAGDKRVRPFPVGRAASHWPGASRFKFSASGTPCSATTMFRSSWIQRQNCHKAKQLLGNSAGIADRRIACGIVMEECTIDFITEVNSIVKLVFLVLSMLCWHDCFRKKKRRLQ